MLEITCNLCGSSQKRKILEKDGYTLVRCESCGLGCINPQPEPGEISRYYRDNPSNEVYRPKTKSKLRDARKLFRAVRRLTGGKSDGCLLDVGCSLGYLLKISRDSGWQAIGLDLSPAAVAYAQKEFGVDARNTDLLSAGLTGQFFDVVTMYDVLEHTLDPLSNLQQANRLLKKNGLLLAATPDFGHPKAVKQGASWNNFVPPQHLFYFDSRTLKALAEKAGFVFQRSFFRFPHQDGLKMVFRKP